VNDSRVTRMEKEYGGQEWRK